MVSYNPYENLNTLMTESFEQTRKAMEKYLDLFKINMPASHLFTSSDLAKKMQSYGEQNIAAASEFAKKLKLRISKISSVSRPSTCKRN